MPTTKTRIGPEDHGRTMSLEEFAEAEGKPGFLYELAGGVIQVVDIPGLPHGLIVFALSSQRKALASGPFSFAAARLYLSRHNESHQKATPKYNNGP